MMPIRLGIGTPGGEWEDDHLTVVWDVHVESLLCHRAEPGAARQVADLALELGALGEELRAAPVELAHGAGFGDAVAPPQDDACRDQNETNEHERGPRPPPARYAALRHARSRALRARGL